MQLTRLWVLEVKSMSLRVFLAVEGCLKFFGVVFRGVFVWEKSMVSALGFLVVVSLGCGRYSFGVVDGVDCLG